MYMLDARGQPTYLLKTAGLADGNFISARFVSVSDLLYCVRLTD